MAETRYDAKILKEVEGTTKFLLDNNVDLEVLLRYLDGQGLSADELPLRLINRPDDEVLAEARRQDRVLLTHDADFLNEALHPPETNPGVVVMPGGRGDVAKYLPNIGAILKLMKPYRALWRQTYIHIQESGMIVVKGVNSTTGEPISPWYLRFENGVPHQWVDDAGEAVGRE